MLMRWFSSTPLSKICWLFTFAFDSLTFLFSFFFYFSSIFFVHSACVNIMLGVDWLRCECDMFLEYEIFLTIHWIVAAMFAERNHRFVKSHGCAHSFTNCRRNKPNENLCAVHFWFNVGYYHLCSFIWIFSIQKMPESRTLRRATKAFNLINVQERQTFDIMSIRVCVSKQFSLFLSCFFLLPSIFHMWRRQLN